MQPEKPEIAMRYAELLVRILRDTAVSLGFGPTVLQRDEVSVVRRVDSEGMSFITEDLPTLGKAFDKALAQDTIIVVPPCFKATRYGSIKIPVFLGTLWKLVFRPDGKIKENDEDCADKRAYRRLGVYPDNPPSIVQVTAVRAIRQICYLGYKLEYPFDRGDQLMKIMDFKSIDHSLPECGEQVDLSYRTRMAIENANALVAFTLRGLNPERIVPRHGPGAVATGEKPWEKFRFQRFYPKLDRIFNYSEYFYFNMGHLCDELDSLMAMGDIPEATSKIVLVPKDSRGPRLISMEPLELQWIQQGLAREIIKLIENSRSITAGYVNFTDQDVNRDLALDASARRGDYSEFITLDLKDASDRVSLWLVKKLFPDHLYACLCACRSGEAKTPFGDVVSLKKFASMGSALCFPVEALIFWALSVGSLVNIHRRRDFDNLPEVFVYGDDIIIHRDHYGSVRSVFEELFLKFNDDKCCVGRFFRESCGCDAFKGHDVTPIRLHTLIPRTRRWSPNALLSYVAYANSFSAAPRYMASTSTYIEDMIQENRKYPLPLGQRGCDYPLAFQGRTLTDSEVTGNAAANFPHRYNKRLQRFEVKLPVISTCTVNCADELGWNHLWSLNQREDDPFGFKQHEDSGTFTIPHIVKLRGAWVDSSCLLARHPLG